MPNAFLKLLAACSGDVDENLFAIVFPENISRACSTLLTFGVHDVENPSSDLRSKPQEIEDVRLCGIHFLL